MSGEDDLGYAEARIAALEAGTEFRDDSISKLERKVQHWQERTEAAEARLADALEALKKVRSFFDSDSHEYADELAFVDATLAKLKPVACTVCYDETDARKAGTIYTKDNCPTHPFTAEGPGAYGADKQCTVCGRWSDEHKPIAKARHKCERYPGHFCTCIPGEPLCLSHEDAAIYHGDIDGDSE